MLIILLNWFLVACLSLVVGQIFNKTIQLKSTLSIDIISGLILLSLILHFTAFFLPINNTILYGLLLIVTSYLAFQSQLRIEIWNKIKLEFFSKQGLFILFSAIVFAAYSSCLSKINDDGLYYTQTIKWLREYGFVHGISNLHVSLGLSSSWHILQSLFIFSEDIYTNDLNGFVMLIYTVFITDKLSKNRSILFSVIQYILVLIISIPFYSAPNPDFPIIVFTAIAIDSFLNDRDSKFIILLAVFCITIKISAIAVFLLGLCSSLYYRKFYSMNTMFFTSILLILALFMAKNIYQTAYPFYPIKIFSFQSLDWKTPEPIIDYFSNGVKTWAYSDKFKPSDIDALSHDSYTNIIYTLLTRGGVKGYINQFIAGLSLVSLIVFLYLSYKRQLAKKQTLLIFVCFVNLVIWFLYAPQYRFILPVLVFFMAWITSFFLERIKIKIQNNTAFVSLSILLFVFMLPPIIGSRFSISSKSTYIGNFESISLERILQPSKQYQFAQVDTLQINNSMYFHPSTNRYCWNVPIPCMSKGYEDILRNSFRGEIVLRTSNLKNGFKLAVH